MCNFSMSVPTLSRLENSDIPAQTHQLEALAEVYETSIANLVSRPPTDVPGLREIVTEISTEDEPAVIALIQAFQAGKRASG